ncbi:MAG TPA: hypothetical protein VGQ09_15460 [Chitinophagaceae bacterium]|jgi:hypothetical protein|nr:hypothetical protein [Chitinophagaceae bacterium]
MPKKKIRLDRYSVKELSVFYDVCHRTMKKWIAPFSKDIGEKVGRYYNANQVKIIFDKLGLPGNYELE